MISPLEMRVLDRNAQYFGLSTLDLMEAAGKAVAEVARSEFGTAGKRILVLCGTGNNGGDGLVAARYLGKEARVTVLLEPRNEIDVRTQTLQLEMDTARIWAQLNFLVPEGTHAPIADEHAMSKDNK